MKVKYLGGHFYNDDIFEIGNIYIVEYNIHNSPVINGRWIANEYTLNRYFEKIEEDNNGK